MYRNDRSIKLTVTLLLTALGLGSLGNAQARALSAIRVEGTLHVLAPADLPPFSYVAGGVNLGFELELLGTIAADMGLKLDVQHAPSNQLFAALQEDRADVALAALAITSTREQKVDFTQPTLCASMSVISSDPKLQLHTDLEGKTVGVVSGTVLESYVQHLGFQKIVKVYPTINDVTLALFSKQIDATFGYTIMKPILEKLYPKFPVVFGPPLFSVPIGMAVPDNDATLRSALNIGLIKVMHDGRYEKLSQKYFGQDVRCKRGSS